MFCTDANIPLGFAVAFPSAPSLRPIITVSQGRVPLRCSVCKGRCLAYLTFFAQLSIRSARNSTFCLVLPLNFRVAFVSFACVLAVCESTRRSQFSQFLFAVQSRQGRDNVQSGTCLKF